MRSTIQHPMSSELYQYVLGLRFDPGAMAEAFLPMFALPVVSFRGRGRVAGTMQKEQPPQVWFHRQVGINGLGGLQVGQVISQPLIDPGEIG